MPVHDWTRVSAGIFHAFHHSWIEEIARALNTGLLPAEYYALPEQVAGEFGPDVLTLKFQIPETDAPEPTPPTAAPLVLAPPRVRFTATTEMEQYTLKTKSVVVRHSSGDHVVALVEVVSPGNKASRNALRRFVDKVAAALYRGYHLLVADLHPPGRRDPQGIHGAIWDEIADDSYRAPADKPLTLAAYETGQTKRAYVEPVAVGDVLPDMPLYLSEGVYINAPLEAAYQTAYRFVPQRWRRVLEGAAP